LRIVPTPGHQTVPARAQGRFRLIAGDAAFD
jgi:hypothetical protein